MRITELLCLAAALAMDAFSVSVSSGMNKHCNIKNALVMSLAFGLFQFIMPLLGNGAALLFAEYTEKYSPLIVAAVLAFIGVRMIIESVRGENSLPVNPFTIPSVIMLAVATSIDAFAAGISIGVSAAPIMHVLGAELGAVLIPSVIIGIVAALFSLFGLCIGKFSKRLIPFPAEIAGGIILLIIAAKSLLTFIF